MVKQKIFPKIFLLLLAILFMGQGCALIGGPRPEARVELVWWKPFEELSQIQPLLEAFQKAHPNVVVTYVKKNIETYEEELLEGLAAGAGPDIFSIHNDWLPKYQNKLTPAPPKLLGLREFGEQFVEVASFDLVAEDKIYALPLAVDVLALYYNKDILSSSGIVWPPASWEELVKLTPKLTRQDQFGNFERSAVALGTADNINRGTDILGLLMLQNGSTFYSPDRRFTILSETQRDAAGNVFSPAETALIFYTQFANPAKVTYTWNQKSNNSIEAFSNGQVAMILSYAYLRESLESRAPFLNYGIAPVPQIDPKKSKINYGNYWAEAVSKQSQKAEAAWQFLKFVSQKEVLQKYYQVKKQPSPRLDLISEQIADAKIGVFAEQALSARSYYKPDSDAVERILGQMINDVVLRNISPQEALQAASQKINLILRNF